MGLFKSTQPEYQLENVAEQNRLHPRTFLKPSMEDIRLLKVGACVNLIFLLNQNKKNACRAEKMWVIITKINNGIFYGQLDNEPYYLKTIKKGDIIPFTADNIAKISYGTSYTFDLNKIAVITNRALDRRQINWLLITDDITNDQYSGWQLFYGDEDGDYLAESKNSTIVPLKHILSFEPLLEFVFGQDGNAYEYSKQKNVFIEAKNCTEEFLRTHNISKYIKDL